MFASAHSGARRVAILREVIEPCADASASGIELHFAIHFLDLRFRSDKPLQTAQVVLIAPVGTPAASSFHLKSAEVHQIRTTMLRFQ